MDWEGIFKKKGIVFNKPHEDIKELIRFLKKNKVKRVLDLGCGTGRHAILLSKAGFDVYACDVSSTAIDIAKKRLKQRGLKAKFKKFNCFGKFPYKDNFFDAVISVQVINHGYHNQIKKCIKEIERVVDGFVFITATKNKKRIDSPNVKKVGRVYIPLEGEEKGLPHFIYNKKILTDDFKNFKLIDFHVDSGSHYVFLGKSTGSKS